MYRNPVLIRRVNTNIWPRFYLAGSLETNSKQASCVNTVGEPEQHACIDDWLQSRRIHVAKGKEEEW